MTIGSAQRKELNMETRAKDLAGEAKNLGRETKEMLKEATDDWTQQAKAAGTAAYQKAQAAYQYAQDKAVAGAKATDEAIRENPYRALGIAFGVGVLIGFLAKRR